MNESGLNSITLETLADLKRDLALWNGLRERATVTTRDVFRITRMYYRNGSLYIFLTGHIDGRYDRVFQFYVRSPCTLYSYRRCYNYHANLRCRDDCRSYKTFVMPGLRGVSCDKINVIKYARPSVQSEGGGGGKRQYDCADFFLKDVNRVHMQIGLVEGNYVKFSCEQTVLNNGVQGTYKDLIVVDAESLEREIPPVIACYDLETHTDGRRMSDPSKDHIISISLVVRRDKSYKKICLYYLDRAQAVDLVQRPGGADTVAVAFSDEGAMIEAFFELLPIINFDYLLDYNGDAFDLPFLLQRSKLHLSRGATVKIARYDLKPVSISTEQLWDKFQNKIDTHHFSYYMHVDLYQFLSSDSEQNDVENFRLNTVAQHYLKSNKVDLKITDMVRLYREKRMAQIVEYNVQDSVLPIELFVKLEIIEFVYTQCMVLFLCTDDVLKNISHKVNVVLFQKALTNKRTNADGSETADPYFFYKTDLSVTSGRKASSETDRQMVDLSMLDRRPVPANRVPADAVKLCAKRERCVYKGGKVLSPIPGMYKSVVTLDFNSLYLNIMKNEGICLSNVFVATDDNVYLDKNLDAVNPKLLEELLSLRTKYKNLRDKYDVTSFKYNLYDKIQNAVKRIANSIYGYYGIFFKPLANYVTRIGREKLSDAIRKIEAFSNDPTILERFGLTYVTFRVIYGDTDSSFIQVDYSDDEIPVDRQGETVRRIVNEHVLKGVNESWNGYKMALENVMPSLILLKKKKYCYLNSENRIKYKGWLVKKDMPIFMRKSFRDTVDMLLLRHSVGCAMSNLTGALIRHYENFGAHNMADYCFSMTFNENPSGRKRKATEPVDDGDKPKRRIISIAKHCVEILKSSGTDFVPGNGDRVPYLLRDTEGNVTAKAHPVQTLDPAETPISWVKHVGIMCTFINELIQVFGDRPEFEHYFGKICGVYMSKMIHDVKHPVLRDVSHRHAKSVASKKKKKPHSDDEDDSADSESDDGDEPIVQPPNYRFQFSMNKRPSKLKKPYEPVADCAVCRIASV